MGTIQGDSDASGALDLARGGTNATTAAGARLNLGFTDGTSDGEVMRWNASTGAWEAVANVTVDPSDNSITLDILKLTILTAEPSSPANGDIVYADGTSWNPGGGAGFYGRTGGAWVKLH